MTGPPRAVLDSDVIFSRVLHELLGRLASQQRLLTLLWSEELLEEARRVLVERKGLEDRVARRWVGYLREAFPEERVALDPEPAAALLRTLTLDRDDEHVCALALAGHADLLLTRDRGYLAVPLARRGVEVVRPDAFLSRTLKEEPEAVLDVLRGQAQTWGGGRSLDDLLAALDRADAPRFAARARAAFG